MLPKKDFVFSNSTRIIIQCFYKNFHKIHNNLCVVKIIIYVYEQNIAVIIRDNFWQKNQMNKI